jgi:hypothetical protein
MDVTLDDLFSRCFDGMMLVALDASSLDPVPISAVRSGRKCGCVCPICYGDMVARKGSVRTHSFAHQADARGLGCAHAAESILHRLAKAVMERKRRIRVADTQCSDELGPLTIVDGKTVLFDRVELEKRVGEVIPDVVCTAGGRKLHVEFKVTHGCSAEKLAKLAQLDVAVMEVDLSSYRHFKLKELDFIILDEAPRTMLLSPLHVRGKALLDRRIAETAEEVVRRMAAFQPMRTREVMFSTSLERTLRSPFISEFVDGLRLFEIAELEWQSWILWTILQRPDVPPTTAELVGAFRANEWVGDHEKLIKPSVAKYARDVLKTRVLTLDEIVVTFLRHMGDLGLVKSNQDGKWIATADLATYEKNRKVKRGGRPGLAQQLVQRGLLDYRKRIIGEHYSAILGILEPTRIPDPEGWLLHAARHFGLTPFEIGMESYLLEELAALRRDVERGRVSKGRSLLDIVLLKRTAEPAWPT